MFILSLPIIIKRVNFRNIKPVTLKIVLKFAIPFLPAGIFTMIMELANRYLLYWMAGTQEVGLYSAGYKLGIFGLIVVMGFNMGNVFVMAGVPMVMQAMVSSLDGDRIKGGKPVRSRSIGAYLAESQVAGKLAVIQNEHPDVDLGSYPFYRKDGYGTNLVMRGTDESELDEMKDKVRAMIVSFGAEPFEE